MKSADFYHTGRWILRAILIGAIGLSAACSQSTETVQQKQVLRYQQPLTDLTEDARASCSYAGGTPSLIHELNGAQSSVCQFANGKRCNERALLSGSCGSVL
ncbi:DUF333 domain-containing protein [Morganella psychrotolerans]|uniref:DUF333 domain-containing protein n=1 Tax=Morganella psychrotolerans TaxID=368603 RepID=A0A1B8HTZ5_9GAMM|nr:DUF333 domain-containing protein [Morganella psychrotolerans]OBU13241.1 hypothetical protein AYY18_00330 [Morganella psychrotolerans]